MKTIFNFIRALCSRKILQESDPVAEFYMLDALVN